MRVGDWIRHTSVWYRQANNGRKTNTRSKANAVNDIVRAEVIAIEGVYVYCEDVDGYESPSRSVRPDFPEHLRWFYPQYRFREGECIPIKVDEEAKRLKRERCHVKND